MNLKILSYSKTINEKISFNYKIPKNKSQLMYDFYLLTALPTWQLGGGMKAPAREDAALKMLADEAQKKIVSYLQPHLLDIVFFAMASEFRHILAFGTYGELEKLLGKTKLKKYINALGVFEKDWESLLDANGFDYLDSYIDPQHKEFFFWKTYRNNAYEATKKTWSDKEFVKLAEKVFIHKMWKTTATHFPSGRTAWADYGGPSWSNIAKGWQKLAKASSYDDKVVYIDHIFDLQHNTDSVLNKSKEYADENGHYDWIGTALEIKKHATSLFDLVDDASPAAKSFSARLIKAATGDTYDAYMKRYRDLTAAIR